ncbi:MAG: hypothetical protein ACHQFW_10360 [Chitinophagales bacterium]
MKTTHRNHTHSVKINIQKIKAYSVMAGAFIVGHSNVGAQVIYTDVILMKPIH